MTNLLITHASQIATPIGSSGHGGSKMGEIKTWADGAIFISDGIIKAVGATDYVLNEMKLSGVENADQVINAHGKSVIPGFIDSHTHFIFSGYRLNEFCERLSGKKYLEIMEHGGGIQATVNKTRTSPASELFQLGMERLDEMIEQGVTTVEGKSGYGLNLDTEIKQLQVMRELDLAHQVDVASTYLGAHAVPQEFRSKPDDYVSFIINQVLPVIKEKDLAEFVDVFCEKDVFTNEQTRKILTAAKGLGFKLKLHADEIENLDGASLAAELGAVSADHLLTISDKEIDELSSSKKTVATLLPGTAFCLQETYAPARQIIDSGCSVALASDYNPGSAFTCSIPLIIGLASMQMKMTPEEILTALTLNAAAAIDRAETIGSIEVGKKADLQLVKYPDYRYLVYKTGMNIVDTVVKNGEVVVK